MLVFNALIVGRSLRTIKYLQYGGTPGKLSNYASARNSTNMPGSTCFLPCNIARGQDDGLVRHLPSGKSMSSGNKKAVVVVAVGGTHVPAVVAPGTAAKHTAGAPLMTTTLSLCIQGWKHT